MSVRGAGVAGQEGCQARERYAEEKGKDLGFAENGGAREQTGTRKDT